MSASPPALVKTWSVGRYEVTLTVQRPIAGGITHALVEWSPHQPDDLTVQELEQYRAGRNAAFAELGLLAAVLDSND